MRPLVTDNLPLLTGAPNGISLLRSLILDLAIRGKLVGQDATDEPAVTLVQQITAARLRTARQRKSKASAAGAPLVGEPRPYALPVGWLWTTLGSLAQINPRNSADNDVAVSFVPMALIGTKFDSGHGQEVRKWGEVKQGFTHFAEGDIAIAKITPCFENSKSCVFRDLKNGVGAGTTELHVVRPLAGTLEPRYVLAYLKSPWFLLVGETLMTGTAGQKRLPKDFVEQHPFPLPPLSEQHRIVAKVDELMVLCDRLEADQSDSEAAHAQLVQALLASLTQASDAADFRASWQQLAEHFHTLFTTQSSIDALENAILQLGVTGRLVIQDSTDEPARLLLEKLSQDRQQSAFGLGFKDARPSEPAPPPDTFKVPSGWEWTTLASLFRVITDGDHQAPPKTDEGIAFLTIGNITAGRLSFDGCRQVDKAYFNAIPPYRRPEHGDLLYTVVGATYGRPVLVDTDRPFCVQRHIAILKRGEHLSARFALFLLKSPMVYEQASSCTTGTAQPTIPLKPLRNFVVPLPPIAEQHRIVAKLDELLGLCKQLKQNVTSAETHHGHLATVLVDKALA